MGTRLCLVLFLLMVAQVMARGGGRSSGGYSSSSSYSYRSHSHYSSYGGGGGEPIPVWAIILIVVICVIVLLCVCASFSDFGDQVTVDKVESQGRGGFNRTLSYSGTIPCYLCLNKVRNSEWDSGDHRKRCAFKNQRELLGYPQPYDAYCPNCNEQLRLWPAKGHPFYCDECPYNERSVLKRSTGHNRLNCFLCDYDCCANCGRDGKVSRRIEEPELPRQFIEHERQPISDEEINRLASGLAVRKCIEEEPQPEISDEEMNRLASGLAVRKCEDSGSGLGLGLGLDDEFSKFASGQKLADQEFPKGQNLEPTPYYNPEPYCNPDQLVPHDLRQRGHSPFILPRDDNPPAYPAEQYSSEINTSAFIHPAHPNIISDSSHPSLPYAIQPSQQQSSTPYNTTPYNTTPSNTTPYNTTTPYDTTTPYTVQPTQDQNPSDWTPSAPPLIKPYQHQ